jgi:hypothetical protein
MSEPEVQRGSGRWHLNGIVLVTVIVMVLGVAVVVSPERKGVPQMPATPVAVSP